MSDEKEGIQIQYHPAEILGGGEEFWQPTWFKVKNGVKKGRDYVLKRDPLIVRPAYVSGEFAGTDVEVTPKGAERIFEITEDELLEHVTWD